MGRKLQNEDFKTEADLTGAGGSASQLLNDSKIWVTANSLNKTLDDAIAAGDFASGVEAYDTISATTTLTYANKVVYASASGGNIDADLPTAVGNEGKGFTIVRSDQTLANYVQIDPDGAQTIGGASTLKLWTQGESVEIISDNSNWIIKSRYIPSIETSYTPTFSNIGTVTLDYAYWMRVGNKLKGRMRLTTGTTAASIASVSLPSGLSISSTLTSTGIANVGWWSRNATDQKFGLILIDRSNSSTVLYFGGPENNGAAGGLTRQNGNAVFGSTEVVVFNFEVPIDGWDT